MLTLAARPLSRLTGRSEPLKLRRALGLLAFFYASAHLFIFVYLDKGLDWSEISADFTKRRFIIAGLASFLLMFPLAVTSTDGWVRRLGKNWIRLHYLVYPAALLGVLHFYLLVKADVSEPFAYFSAVGVLLGWRVMNKLRRPASVSIDKTPKQG